ncbi:MAG: hypothetical protein HQ596_01625 [Candidatus Saganbacteria bacterium]|nr:hypothetical protein [Candidatus Saganbacteria bacterium]
MKKIILILGLIVIFSSNAMAMIVGLENGSPYLRFAISENQAIDVGADYASLSNSSTTQLDIWGRFNHKIAEIGAVTASWAGTIGARAAHTSAADTTTITLIGLVSASYPIAENLVIYGNLNLFSLASASSGGTSTTSYALIWGDTNVYSGVRVLL